MMFESRNRAARSGLASTPRHGGFLIKSPPGSTGTLGRLRAQLLGGAAGIALPAASMVVALGVGLSTEAQAQTSSFNGTQATTYTLTTGANTGTFTFGPNTVIGPTTPGTPGVTGDTLTGWNVINQGQISGSAFGIGIDLTTAGGNSVTNSGSITGEVRLGAGGSVSNLAGGTITSVLAADVTNAGTITGVALSGSTSGSLSNQSGGVITGSVGSGQQTSVILTNAGTIGGSVGLAGGGSVINQSGAAINQNNNLNGVYFNFVAGTVVNAGAIKGNDNAIRLFAGDITNLNGGTITSAAGNGVYIFALGSVTNAAGGTITGATMGISSLGASTVTNAGAITGTATNGVDLEGGGSVSNQSGGTISGAVNGVGISNSFSAVTAGTVTNAGAITGTSGAGVSIVATNVSVTNLAGGTITGTIGVDVAGSQPATINNAGTITGTGGTAIRFSGLGFSGGGLNSLILQTMLGAQRQCACVQFCER
jgi:hypothetical protein